LISLNECINIVNQYNNTVTNDTLTGVNLFPVLGLGISWLSTTNPTLTSIAFEFDVSKRYCSSNTRLKAANTLNPIFVTNARHLITAP
jgi:hypothetical protein